jgi:hypothetical protein
MEVTSGFLIVNTFERMYREYLAKFKNWWQIENPKDEPLLQDQMPGKYRGVARDPMQPWDERFRGSGFFEEPIEQELDASLFLAELCKSKKADGWFIYQLGDAKKLFGMIQSPVEREIIWARNVDIADQPPPGAEVLGYEPIDFDGDFTSLIANVLFFRYRLGKDTADPDGTREKFYYSKLNKWGLFDSPAQAKEYANTFALLPDHERPRHIAEVRIVAETFQD